MGIRSGVRPVALLSGSLLLMVMVSAAFFAARDRFLTNVIASTPTPSQKAEQISKDVAAQIAALNREKESRTAAQRKIESRLLYTIKNVTGRAGLEGIPTLKTGIEPDTNGNLIVDIRVKTSQALIDLLEKLNARIIYRSDRLRTIVAEVPLLSIESIAELPEVVFISPKEEDGPASTSQVEIPSLIPDERAQTFDMFSAEPSRLGSRNVSMAGSVVSEGDLTHRAALARQLTGSDGTGVKIGVLSDSVNSLAARQASGDLPGNVTVVGPGPTPSPGGTPDEGTAMLEIVHDLAPGAQLYFATATGSGSAAFADNIRTLRNVHGCDIIIDDWTYFAETPFQDGQATGVVSNTNGGVVIQAVNEVTAAGALYFSSAGNSGNKNDGTAGAWEGDFVSGGAAGSPLPAGLELHDFGGGALFNTVSLQASVNAGTYLKWSDPLGGSANDYDFYVLDSTGTSIVSASTNIQNGTQDPQEIVARPATGNRLVVVRKVGAAGRFLHINTNRGRLAISTSGVVHGHNAGRNTQSTAASPARGPFPASFSGSNSVETFSSDGPRRIFFNANSTEITPGNVSSTGGELLAKPDMTAADGVTTTTPGFLTFFGTSAAAPHAGAIAALIKSANPSLTASQISAAMKSAAIDIEQPGYDRDSGAGIVMPLRAMSAAGVVAGNPWVERGSISVTERVGNGNSTIDAGETWNLFVALDNVGLQNVTNVSATLTPTTAGVTVVPSAIRTYPDLAAAVGSATNGEPFAFSLPANFACGSVVTFSLSIHFSFQNGAGNVSVPVSIQTGNPTVISTTLDADPPPSGNGYTALTNNNQVSRLNRNGAISSCQLPKPTPALQDAVAGRRFDQYTFTASASGCVTVTIVPSNATALYSAAYSGSYDPTNIQANYLADYGVTTAGTIQYSFNVTAGQQYVIVVHEITAGGGNGVNYTLNVDGPRTGGCIQPFAQLGEVFGRVFANGRFRSGARVLITDGGSNTRMVETNTFGFFRVSALPPGQYTLSADVKLYAFGPVPLNVSGSLSGVEINATPR